MQSRNTTALFVLHQGNLVVAPSKAQHKLVSQVDPPCCSDSFTCEGERIEHIVNSMLSPNVSGKNFHNHFHLIKQPIKFPHKDALGDKLFTGYVAIVKNEKTLKNEFLIDESETLEGIDEIVNGTTHIILSPMFKKAIMEIKENSKLYQL